MTRIKVIFSGLMLVGLMACYKAKKEEPQTQQAPQPAKAEQPMQDPAPQTAAQSAQAQSSHPAPAASNAAASKKPTAAPRRETRTAPTASLSQPVAESQPQSQPPMMNQPAAPPPPPPRPTVLTLPLGTSVEIRLTQGLSSSDQKPGNTFSAALEQDLAVDGQVLAPRGSTVTGRISDVAGSGRVKGHAHISLILAEIQVSGESYPIRTNSVSFEAEGTKGRDAKVVGGTAALGAIIGAIAGGGKGAAIGAAAGGGAGAATVMVTKGKEVELEPEQKFTFRLEQDVTIKIPNSALSARSQNADSGSIGERLGTKLKRFESVRADYVARGGDPAQADALKQEFDRLMRAGRHEEAEPRLDQALALVQKR